MLNKEWNIYNNAVYYFSLPHRSLSKFTIAEIQVQK